MAILNGLEGQAHVESDDSLSNWHGHIILAPDPANIRYFDIAGPAANGIYEGPVMIAGECYFMNGDVLVRKVGFSSSGLRVEFVGNGKLNKIRPLPIVPDDYLP
jgi:hypothetical protein